MSLIATHALTKTYAGRVRVLGLDRRRRWRRSRRCSVAELFAAREEAVHV